MGADDELDALRRRLYAPDATDADRAAFQAAEVSRAAASKADASRVRVAGAPAAAAPAGAEPRRPVPARWRVLAIGGTTVLVVAGVVALAVGHPFATPRPTASAVHSSGTSVTGSIAVPPAQRAGFIRRLQAGDAPGLLAYLDEHPTDLLRSLSDVAGAGSSEFAGGGPTTLTLSPTITAGRTGHITLVVVTDQAVHFTWTATVEAQSNDRSGPDAPVAPTDDGAAEAGEPVSSTVRYSGGVPSRLTLLLPSGTRWGAVVVYTD